MPLPKDPIKLKEYKEKMSKIAKEKGYGKWMKGRPSVMKGKKHSTETIKKLKKINKENALKYGYGKWMKGRKLEYVAINNKKRLKGKTYTEIYGDRAEEEALKRKISNRNRWIGRESEPQREKHNSDFRYIEWRKSVFERDNYICQNCKTKGGVLNAHHIKKWSEFRELRYNIKNGITLCIKCHKEKHKRD